MKSIVIGIMMGFLLATCTNRDPSYIIDNPLVHNRTYCNPINLDYTYMSHNKDRFDVSYRSGADPSYVFFRGYYCLFVTRSHGYWISPNMKNWTFVKPENWFPEGSNAPAVYKHRGKLLLYGDPSGSGKVLEAVSIAKGIFKSYDSLLVVPEGIQDPALFMEGKGETYLYEGSSNTFPIRGVKLDKNDHYKIDGDQVDLFNLDPEHHGWERFGENHNSEISPFIEGPWMTKNKGTYYLEYSAPGTQWNVYADGVYTSTNPLDSFRYASYNPVSYKPNGFLRGAGHGSTGKDVFKNNWHFATSAISVNYMFERRISMFPAGFEEDGQLYINTAYGDYPHYLPHENKDNHRDKFTGWMLLSYKKPISTNAPLNVANPHVIDESETGYMLPQILDFDVQNMVDEDIRSYWVSGANHDSVEIVIDLEQMMDVKAVQVNFHDFNNDVYGRKSGIFQYYTIETSRDGVVWEVVIDISNNRFDMPHGYFELEENVEARYIRYNHVDISSPYLAISGLRVFGKGKGLPPISPNDFSVERQEDQRNVDIQWQSSNDAMGHTIYWGIKPDRLNNNVMVYDSSHYQLRALNVDQPYYYQIEAFNENGISERSPIVQDQVGEEG